MSPMNPFEFFQREPLEGLVIECKVAKQNGKILYKAVRPNPVYRIMLQIGGSLDKVYSIREVTYRLHKTFDNPNRLSTDVSSRFKLVLWVWGEFDMKADIIFKSGQKATLKGQLEFSNQLPAEDDKYKLIK